jgi:glycosyltransferase involved in cell wall biosynthesis
MPKLSIITINRNNSRGLRTTVESVARQTFTDFEYIIIDGNSSDDSLDIIKEFVQKYFTAQSKSVSLEIKNHLSSGIDGYWLSEPDSGIYNAMNKGIRKANGEYLLFLNSGDALYNQNTLRDVFNSNFNEDIVSGKAQIFSAETNKNKSYPGISKEDMSLSKLLETSLNHQATFVKRELFDKYGCYDETFSVVSDWVFILKTIIMNNATYNYLNMDIATIEPSGVSTNHALCREERERALKQLVPELVLKDYSLVDFYGYKSVKQNLFTWYCYVLLRKLASVLSVISIKR